MEKEYIALLLLMLAVMAGGFLILKEEYERQIRDGHSKIKALLRAMNEYFIKDLGYTFLKIIVGGPVIIFFIGGLIGLLIFGWRILIDLI